MLSVNVAQAERAVEAVRERDHLDVELRVVDARAPRRPPGSAGGSGPSADARSGSAARRTRPSTAPTGWCCANARATPAVPSGRSAMRRPPLSSKSYISLRTTSVDSPTRWNTSRCSKIGRDDQVEAVARRAIGERRHQRRPLRRLRRQDVVRCRWARGSAIGRRTVRPPWHGTGDLTNPALPIGRLVILQELPVHVLARVEPGDDRDRRCGPRRRRCRAAGGSGARRSSVRRRRRGPRR